MKAQNDHSPQVCAAGAREPWFRDHVVLLVASLGAFACGVLGVITLGSRPLWHDELFSRWISALSPRSYVYHLGGEANMWAYYSGLWLWRRVVGDSDALLRFPSVLAACASVVAIAAFTFRLYGRRLAVLCALLAAVNPFMVRYAQEVRGYTLVVLLSILSAHCFLLGREDAPTATRWRVLWVAFSVAAYYTHQFGLFVTGAALLAEILSRGRAGLRLWVRPFLAFCVLSVPMVVATVIDLADPSGSQIAWVRAPGFVDLREAGRLLGGPTPLQLVLLAAVFTGVAVSISQLTRRRDRQFRETFLLTWLFLPIVVSFALAPVKHLLVPRYLIVSVPPALILAAVGISWLARRVALAVPRLRERGLVVVFAAVLVAASLAATVDVLDRPPAPRRDRSFHPAALGAEPVRASKVWRPRSATSPTTPRRR